MPAGVDLLAEDLEPGDLILLMNPTDSESDNPLYTLRTTDDNSWRSRFLGAANVRYAATDWLKIDGNVSFDRSDRRSETFREKGYRTTDPSPTVNDGTLYKFESTQRGPERQHHGVDRASTSRTRSGTPPRSGTCTRTRTTPGSTPAGTSSPWRRCRPSTTSTRTTSAAARTVQTVRADGYFFITNFDMYDKYVVDALIRNDGSSLFGEDERRQWYYRLGGAWRMSQEDFFNLPAVDELKFRYSLGTAGGRPRFSAQYETYSVCGGRIPPVNLGNKDLKPEFSTEHEAGVDLACSTTRRFCP